jgi:hypothetical protein
MAETKMFEVEKGRVISSVHYGRDFREGEVIDLSFASEEDIAALVASGAVKPTAKKKMTPETGETKAEVTNG